MLNKIINFALSNRFIVLIITGLLLIWGCFTIFKTDVDIFPDLNAPTVTIMTETPGFAPEEVEKLVTYPIETAMNGATDVRRVRSSSAMGFSTVWVEFDWGADVFKARQIESEKLNEVKEKLPPGINTPTIGPQTSILGEIMIISLTADSTSLMQLRTIADRVMAPRILALGGVAQVSVIGGDVAEYQIKLLPERMKYHNVTLDEVRSAASNVNTNASGGIIYDYGNEYIIKGNIHTSSANDIAKSVIRSDENGIITIGDIALVEIGPEMPRLGLASEKARGAVLLTVNKQPSTSTIDLIKQIETTLVELKSSLPTDAHISTDIFRQSDFIQSSISNLQESLLEGAFFVILVLFLFLMNIRTTIISVVALPLSIIVTLLILYWLGISVNTMTLGGIAIAIGSLVDDAIVDVENVYKRLRQNRLLSTDKRKSIIQVVYNASCEVRLPILNSSLIIVASFIPLFFLSGVEGRMLIPLGISFIVALAASTIVALTVTPILCSYLLSGDKTTKDFEKEPYVSRKMASAYKKSLDVIMHHKKTILIATSISFIFAVILIPFLGRSFLPPFNEGSLTINVSTLPGLSLEESDKIGREAEKIIMSMPEVKTVARKTGRAELDAHSRGANVSEIEAPYTLSSRSREEFVRDVREKLSHLPGTNIEIGQPISHRIDAMLSGTETQIAIKIFGDDLDLLYSSAQDIRNAISDISGVVDINIEQQIGRPQIEITPRREMLTRYGITNEQFATYINTLLGGERVSQVYDRGIPYNLTLKVNDSSRKGLDDISNLMIDSNQGKIPLNFVADIISTTGPNTINRENINRRIVISANTDGRDLRGAVNEIQKNIEDKVKLPEGYYITYSGQFESEAQASRILMIASLVALLIIFMLLFHQFRNISQSLIILANMPLALIGGVIILIVTNGELNIPAIIGFISLMGISTRNGMLLMSHYNQLKDEGGSLMHRIIHGSTDRLNPIIMTALSSALALIPLALRGDEPGNEIQSPMALVILGGLITSTILNLLVVPVLYYFTNKNELINE